MIDPSLLDYEYIISIKNEMLTVFFILKDIHLTAAKKKTTIILPPIVGIQNGEKSQRLINQNRY